MQKMASSVPALLSAFQDRYLHDHEQEHALLLNSFGEIVAVHDGGAHQVMFTGQDLNAACGGTLTHNHPLGRPFSKEDLSLASEYAVTLFAFGVDPEGHEYIYRLRFADPSKPLADVLFNSFDDVVEQAEQRLAELASFEDWSDELWLQKARHVALLDLAKQYGFSYGRVAIGNVQEMAVRRPRHDAHEVARLDMFAALETAMKDDVLSPLHAAIVRALTRHAEAENKIPPAKLDLIIREVSQLAIQTFLGKPQHDGALFPYTVHNGEVIPRSVYFKVLWTAMYGAAAAAIARHAEIMRRYLPEDLLRMFEFAAISPFDTEVSEADGPQYDPLHLWIGADGKTLSDRIWATAGNMRAKLDAYLTDAIAAGKSVQQMAGELEMYLVPGRNTRIETPFGSMNYDAFRLARTEVAAAYARADSASAQLDPFVESYSPFTAPEHQCCDNCDVQEQNGPYPKDDTTHLPPFHPLCICGVIWNMVTDIPATLAALRKKIEDAIARGVKSIVDLIGPLSKRFLGLLFRGRAK